MGYWRAAAKLAWRDLQLPRARPVFLVIAVAVSVASIGGVRSAANVASAALQEESRAWLGGDMAITTGEPVDEEQIEALDRMRSRGIEWTLLTTALTMGASGQSPDASLLAVKAVDPARYPFYGGLTVDPPQALSAALGPDRAVVSPDAMERFRLRLGDPILIGGTKFRVSATIARESDRFSGVTALAVRCLLSQQGFERSGIGRSGGSIRLRILFRLPPGADWAALRARLIEVFPEADLIDFRDANRDAVSILDRTARFLNLTALLALTLGAIGVAMTLRQHIDERAYTLAVMKMLGGRNRQLAGMFFLQVAWLWAMGFAAGLPLAWGIRAAVLSLVGRYVAIPRTPLWDFAALIDTAAAGMAAIGPALVGTALAIGRLKPAIVLRRDFEETPVPGSRAIAGLVWGGACVVLGAIAARLLGSWNLAAILIGTLAVSTALALVLVRALLGSARRWSHSAALRKTPLLRQGIANVCRPGNRGRPLIVVLALGIMMIAATFQIDRAVAQAILEALPFDRPDMLVPAIEAARGDEVRAFLERQPGVEKVEVGAQARVRLASVNGVPVGGRLAAVFRVAGCATGSEGPRGGVSRGELTVADDVARQFGLRLGSRVEFAARGRTVQATVAAVRRMTPVEEFWYALRMDCSGLEPASLFYHAAVRIKPDRIAAVRRAFIAEYPAIPMFTAGDLSEAIGQVSHDALLLARLVAWYALGSSLAVLIAIVSASRGFRFREIAILSILGARRRSVVKLCTIEFAAMGMLAGLIGSVLAYGFTAVMVSRVLRGIHAPVEWKSPVITTIAAGVLSVAAGWLPAYGLLRRKPMDVLQGE